MAQVDRIYGLVGTLGVKAPCRVASTANLTLSGLQTVDGVALAAEDRVLVKDQTNTVENGIYVVTTTSWQRAPDFDGSRDVVKGTNVWVQEGTVGTNTLWYVSAVGTIGTNALTFAERGFTSALDAHSATSKATPVDADELPLLDSAASFSLKKLTWANLKATLLSAFDIAATTHAAASKAIPVDADEFSLVDSAASNVLKKLTWSNLKATLKTYFDTVYPAVATAAEIRTGTVNNKYLPPDQTLAAFGFSNYAQTADQTITAGGSLTLAHGLGRAPVMIQAWLKCTTIDNGYAVNDIVPVSIGGYDAASNLGVSIVPDATNLNVRFGSDAQVFTVVVKNTGGVAKITLANWKFFVRAWA